MRFQRYPKYKTPEDERIGRIPEHWTVVAVKHVSTIRYGIGEPPAYHEQGVPLIRATNVHAGKLYEKALVFVNPDEIPTNRIVWLQEGDIIVVRSGAYTGDSAIIPIGFGPCIAGFDMVLRCERSNPRFMQYALLSTYLKQGQIDLERTRAAQPHLNAEELGSCLFIMPPQTEQVAIVSFLDHETAKIDTLLAKQERLIELLREKRQAVISHAVTKGLDSTVPMKPSGVEWLRDVPRSWELAPIKHLVTMSSGGTPSKDRKDFWDGPYPWASAKDLKVDVLFDTEDHISDAAIEEGGADLIAPEAILIVVRGMILLHTLPVTVNAVPMAINQDLKALRVGAKLLPRYLALLLRGLSKEILGRADQAAHGTKALRMDDWTGMLVPVPAIEEQQTIVQYVEQQISRIDSLIAKAEQAIALQKEHRTALISAAVTGKIDVREEASELQQAA